MATNASHDWIKEIKPELHALDEIPLTGASPPFPWDQLSARLSESLEQKIEVVPNEIVMRAKDQLYEGLGEAPMPLIISIPSLAGNAAWLMPEQEIAALESLLLTKENHPLIIRDQNLSIAFYRFLALEALYNISQLKVDKSFVPILTTKTTFPEEDALSWDISITINQQTLWGRLLISQELRHSWIEYFSKLNQPSALTKDLAKKVETTIHLEVGKTHLSAKEWSTVQIGDWLALDQFYLDPSSLTGRVMITFNGKNLFIGRLKESNIKIVEFPLYHEAEAPMANNLEEGDDDHTQADETTENGAETEESEFEELTEDFELDETLNTDFLTEEHHDTEEHHETEEHHDTEHQDGTEQHDTDHDLTEADLTKSEGDTATFIAEETTHEETTHEPEERVLSTGLDTKHITMKEIPVNLIVELGQIQITMEKLLLLEPGNILDLSINPENGVDLVVNGKRVGKGEVVRLGESIGVRILELG